MVGLVADIADRVAGDHSLIPADVVAVTASLHIHHLTLAALAAGQAVSLEGRMCGGSGLGVMRSR
jgi:hypothetical protein